MRAPQALGALLMGSLSLVLLPPATAAAQDTGTAQPDQDTSDTGASDDDDDVDTDAYPTGGRTVTCDGLGGAALGGWAVLLVVVSGMRRRGVQHLAALLLIATGLGIAPVAHAQQALEPGLDIQRLEPSGAASGFASVYSARQLPKLKVSFELMFNYAYRPLQVGQRKIDTLVRREGVIDHLGAGHARFGFAATEWFDLALSAPVIQIADLGSGASLLGVTDQGAVAFGDVTLELGFRPARETPSGGVGFAIIPFVTAPSGTREYFLTDGTVSFGGRMALSGTVDVVHLAVFGGYKVKVGASRLGTYYAIDDEILYGAGVGFQILPDLLRFNIEATGATTVGPGRAAVAQTPVFERMHTAFEGGGSLMLNTPSGFMFLVGGHAGATPAPGTPVARVYLGLGYVPVVAADPDGDGIRGREDACPTAPEDRDGFEDFDGCPDEDNDDDGIEDIDDACPDDPEDMNGFEDDDGCPEGDADRDGDGIPDATDVCPDQPEDLDGWEDDDGCPDVDNDGDLFLDDEDACPDSPEDMNGVEDDDGCPEGDTDADGDGVPLPADLCPSAAEDIDGFEDDDGCPDPDNDADGVPDTVDLCPNRPEDVDGWEDEDGCPDFDADGDGIPDQVDACPNEPETRNGFEDTDGCPDQARVQLTAERIEITEKVLFVVGKATLDERSYSLLDEVVAVLQGYPEISLIEVAGHTDSTGSDSLNEDLSQRRALAVREYLIGRGIAESRVAARGYGEAYPIAPNSSEEGRAKNRRVEFRILEKMVEGATVPAR